MMAITPWAPTVHITLVVMEKDGWRARCKALAYAARSEAGAGSGQSAGMASVGSPGSGGVVCSAPRRALTRAGGGTRRVREEDDVCLGLKRVEGRMPVVREEATLVAVEAGSGAESKIARRDFASCSFTISQVSLVQGKANTSSGDGRGDGLKIVLTFGGAAARNARVFE
jgi:hypothetical protein